MFSFGHIVIYAVVASFAVIFLMWKFGDPWFQRALGFEILIDGAFTFHMFSLFGFTFSGLITAILGGFCFSVMLRLARNLFGYEVPRIRERKLVWIRTTAKWGF